MKPRLLIEEINIKLSPLIFLTHWRRKKFLQHQSDLKLNENLNYVSVLFLKDNLISSLVYYFSSTKK